MNPVNAPPILGFVAFSGTGKTTLLTQIIPILKSQGLRIAVIKHAHHRFEIDQPGKDSFVLREAGATPVLIASSQRWAMMVEDPHQDDPNLLQCVHKITSTTDPDLILVEGFKHEQYPKIELHRASNGHKLLCTQDHSIIALATDQENTAPSNVVELNLNNMEEIVNFIVTYYHNYKNEYSRQRDCCDEDQPIYKSN